MLLIILIIIIVLLLILVFILKSGKKALVNCYRRNNVYTFGYQGCGKDLINQLVINAFKEPYTANIDYGGDFTEIALKDLHAGQNTFENMIQGKITKFVPNFKEGEDTYLSDCGLYLPCQYNNELNKRYPSMPVHFALRRQLYDSHIHINSQGFGRVWDKLREQCSGFVHAIWVIKLPFILIGKARIYQDYQDAEKQLKPLDVRLFNNKYEKALKRVENSSRGEIKTVYYCILKKHIKYDTRAFKQKMLIDNANENVNAENI